MCVRKFLGCLPPRIGCIVLAYAGIVSSSLVLCWFAYYFREAEAALAHALADTSDLEGPPFNLGLKGEVEHITKEDERMVELIVNFSYIVNIIVGCNFFVHGLFTMSSIFLAIGTHGNKKAFVKAYFVYGFFHFFFMLFLAYLHCFIGETVETTVILIADILFAFCMCGVKGMMDSLSNGKVYTQPAATGYKP